MGFRRTTGSAPRRVAYSHPPSDAVLLVEMGRHPAAAVQTNACMAVVSGHICDHRADTGSFCQLVSLPLSGRSSNRLYTDADKQCAVIGAVPCFVLCPGFYW